MQRELTLHNDVKQIELLTEFIEVLCEELGLDAMLTFNLNLVLEEAVTNVIMYAYPQDEDHTMTLKAWTEQSDNIIAFELKDQGKHFNPIEEKCLSITFIVSIPEGFIHGFPQADWLWKSFLRLIQRRSWI